jgi:hypothetical protein
MVVFIVGIHLKGRVSVLVGVISGVMLNRRWRSGRGYGISGRGRLGMTNPLIALRAHDELSGRIGRESSIGRKMT